MFIVYIGPITAYSANLAAIFIIFGRVEPIVLSIVYFLFLGRFINYISNSF